MRQEREELLSALSVSPEYGLRADEIAPRRAKYGANTMARARQKPWIMRVLGAFCEPMLLILCFALAITLGVNIGKYLRTGEGNFLECVGIFAAVSVSVVITVVMEGKSERAFELLSSLGDRTVVKVLRDGTVKPVPQSEIVVGDIMILEAGCKIAADGRLLSAENLSVDESTLTGESRPRTKRADVYVAPDAPLAERADAVYGGTLAVSGRGRAVVTAVGAQAEIGKIAGELSRKNRISAPLNEKLTRLGKWVTALGGACAAAVFAVTVARLTLTGKATFEAVQNAFTESVVLIVAAVPEGLPTIVALSLSVNVMKLAGENALIKKLVATETAGCISVICTDKTGTLTRNRMTVETFVSPTGGRQEAFPAVVAENVTANSTAEVVWDKGRAVFSGSPTECALLGFEYGKDPSAFTRAAGAFSVLAREEFTSEKKYMSTKTRKNGVLRTYYKGSPERIAAFAGGIPKAAKEAAARLSQNARRLIAFAHRDGDGPVVFDGIAAMTDPVRPDIAKSVALSRKAGIRVKILTGDGPETAFAVARETGIASSPAEVATAAELERLSDKELKARLKTAAVIARSTPLIKLRIVRLLMEEGEVVAVTGDGINDAPAIKQADLGIAMGSGSEIAKEAADVILLDDSYATIVKAIAFGRNVYTNFRRFIMFQLSVNFSAVMIVLAFLFLGRQNPFNALQLLWINIIMDGPPALTLGFEAPSKRLMDDPPVRRSENLLTPKITARILVHSLFMAALITLQAELNFLGAAAAEQSTAVFTLFVMLQLFNAFNCRQTGSESIFPTFFSNKPMLIAFGAVFVLQVAIVAFGGKMFGVTPLSPAVWLRILAVSSSVLAVSEASKLAYRLSRKFTRKKGRKARAAMPAAR